MKEGLGKYRNHLIIAVLVVAAFYMTRNYFKPDLQLILGMLSLPFVISIREKKVYSFRYGILSLIFIGAYSMLQIKVLLFLSLGCLVFYGVESLFGKVGMLPLLFLIFLSPAAEYAVNVFTFSLRLAFSNLAAEVLTLTGMAVKNHGSYFEMQDGSMYSVDTACLGLNMIRTGLCVTVLLIAFTEKRIKKSINLFYIALLATVALLLLMLSNFLRIVGLVLFQSPPETVSHEIIGLLSLVVYMIAPMYYLVQFVVRRFGKEQGPEIKYTAAINIRGMLFLGFLFVFIIATGITVEKYREEMIVDHKLMSLNLEGYRRTEKQFQVMEYQSENALIYIKPAVHGYQTDHSPAVCWQGNGFELRSFKEETMHQFTIMTGELKRENVIQYTAWWYDNGKNKTIDQWEWRLSNGEPYRLINITAKTKDELDLLCKDFLERKLF